MAVTKGSSLWSTARRRIRIGRTLRMSSNGGRVKSSVVRMPAARLMAMAPGSRCRSGWTLTSLASRNGKRELHAQAKNDAEQSSGKPKQQGLDEIDLHHLRAARAEGLHDGDRV